LRKRANTGQLYAQCATSAGEGCCGISRTRAILNLRSKVLRKNSLDCNPPRQRKLTQTPPADLEFIGAVPWLPMGRTARSSAESYNVAAPPARRQLSLTAGPATRIKALASWLNRILKPGSSMRYRGTTPCSATPTGNCSRDTTEVVMVAAPSRPSLKPGQKIKIGQALWLPRASWAPWRV
jgi:hypothetical protein